jgi:hypothetical protein
VSQPTLFDPPSGRQRRDMGLTRVEGRNAAWLARRRAEARQIVRQFGSVTADDLRVLCTGDPPSHPNAWGAVFRQSGWVPVGDHQMRTPSAHARRVRRWTFQPTAIGSTP